MLGQFAESADIYSLHDNATEKIEQVALRKIEAGRGKTIAFCLFKYFPYGGLQRDFLRIALETQARGFNIRVYTLEWEGDLPAGYSEEQAGEYFVKHSCGALIDLPVLGSKVQS